MADVFSKAKRSEVMALIRSRGNRGTEGVVAGLLRAHKISGWRRHLRIKVTSDVWRVTGKGVSSHGKVDGRRKKINKATSPRPSPRGGEGGKRASASSLVTRHPSLSVRPDFVFRKERLAVFVDGCFWHGCPQHGTQPKGNRAFWRKKLASNRARDLRVNRALRAAGWRVVRIWEHALRRATLKPGNEARLVELIRQKLARPKDKAGKF